GGLDAPLAGIAGDQQAALFGHACFAPGMTKNTYGTGSFVLMNVGPKVPPPAEGLLTTVAWTLADGTTAYALEGAVFVTGAAIQWLRDGLGISEVRADGGAAVMDLLCQFQADLLGVPVRRPTVAETTALGATYLAGLAEGVWSTAEELGRYWLLESEFMPAMGRKDADRRQ